MKYRRQAVETIEGATRHLLANLDDAEALRTNPLVAHLLDGCDGPALRARLAAVRTAVDRALAQLIEQAPESEREAARRCHQIFVRYDIRGESRQAVAFGLGISERQMFRDRSHGCKRLVPLLHAQLTAAPRQAASVNDGYCLEYDYCEMMRRLGNPGGAGARLRALGAASEKLPQRIFSWFRAADAFIDAEDDRAVDETMAAARRALLEFDEESPATFERQCIEMLEARRLFLDGRECEALRLAERALPKMRESMALGEPNGAGTYATQCIYVAEWYNIFGERRRELELYERARQALLPHSPMVSTQLHLAVENTVATFGASEEGERRLIESLDAAIRLNEPELVGLTYLRVSWYRLLRHDREGARDLIRRSINAYELAGNSHRRHITELQLALVEGQSGDPDLALALSAKPLKSLSPSGYFGIALPLSAGMALFRKREYELAREKALLVVAESHKRLLKWCRLRSLVLLANCEMRLGHDSQARESIGDALLTLSGPEVQEVYPRAAAMVYTTAAAITRDLRYRLKARECTIRLRKPNSSSSAAR